MSGPIIYNPAVGADDWGDDGYVDILRQIVTQLKDAALPVPVFTFGDEDDVSPARTKNAIHHLQLIKRHLPELRVYANVVAPSSVEVFAPWIDMRAFSSYADQTSAGAMARRPDEAFWMYSGPSGYGMAPWEDRLYRGLYAHRMGISGAGEWVYQIPRRLKAQPEDPWRDFTDRWPHGNNWDYCFAAPDGPLPTLGWEAYREGINDGRYVATLERAIHDAAESGDAKAEALAHEAADHLRRFLERIDLSPEKGVFGTRREAVRFRGDELDEFRRDVSEFIVRLNQMP